MDLTNELIKQIISNGKKLTEDSNFTDELNKCIKNLKDNYNFKNLLDIFSEQSENEDNSEDKCSSEKEEKNDECEFTEAPEDKKIYSKNTMDDFIKDLNEDSSKYIKKQKDDNKSQYKDCNRYPETDSKQEKTLCEELLDELKETVTKEDMIINDVINIVLYIINNRKDEKGYFKLSKGNQYTPPEAAIFLPENIKYTKIKDPIIQSSIIKALKEKTRCYDVYFTQDVKDQIVVHLVLISIKPQ